MDLLIRSHPVCSFAGLSQAVGDCDPNSQVSSVILPETTAHWIRTQAVSKEDIAATHARLKLCGTDSKQHRATDHRESFNLCENHKAVSFCVACLRCKSQITGGDRRLNLSQAKKLGLSDELVGAPWAHGVPMTVCWACRHAQNPGGGSDLEQSPNANTGKCHRLEHNDCTSNGRSKADVTRLQKTTAEQRRAAGWGPRSLLVCASCSSYARRKLSHLRKNEGSTPTRTYTTPTEGSETALATSTSDGAAESHKRRRLGSREEALEIALVEQSKYLRQLKAQVQKTKRQKGAEAAAATRKAKEAEAKLDAVMGTASGPDRISNKKRKPTSTPGPHRAAVRARRAEALVAHAQALAGESDLSSTFRDICDLQFGNARRDPPWPVDPTFTCGDELLAVARQLINERETWVNAKEMHALRYAGGLIGGATKEQQHGIRVILQGNNKKVAQVTATMRVRDAVEMPPVRLSNSGIEVQLQQSLKLIAQSPIWKHAVTVPGRDPHLLVIAFHGDGNEESGQWNARNIVHFEYRLLNLGADHCQRPCLCFPIFIQNGSETGDNLRLFFNSPGPNGEPSVAQAMAKVVRMGVVLNGTRYRVAGQGPALLKYI